MMEKACIDRFEGKQVVILVDDRPMVFPKSSLPKGSKEGDWLKVEIEDDRLVRAELDPEETMRTAVRIAEKLARLRRGEP
jgi:hypothetical protein